MHHLLEHINQDIKGDKAKTMTQIKLNSRIIWKNVFLIGQVPI